MSTPTVKERYEWLMNMGLIKSVKLEINLSKRDTRDRGEFDALQDLKKQNRHFHLHVEGLKVKLKCRFCGGPIHDKPKVLKFASFERCFCYTLFRASYKEKHIGRIKMLQEQYRKKR